MFKILNSLEIADNGFDYILRLRELYGINLRVEELHNSLLGDSIKKGLISYIKTNSIEQAIDAYSWLYNPALISASGSKSTPFQTKKFNSLRTQALREFAKKARTIEDHKTIYKTLSKTSAFEGSDQYFETYILPSLDFAKDRRFIEQLLTSEVSLESSKLSVEVFRKLYKEELETLATASYIEVYDLVTDLDRLLPEGSEEKDEVINDILWDSRLTASDSNRIDKFRSANSRNLDVHSVNFASAITNALGAISVRSRIDVLKYLIEPLKLNMPEEFGEKLEEIIQNNPLQNPTQDRFGRRYYASIMRRKIERNIEEMSPEARVILLQNTLTSGELRLIDSQTHLNQIKYDILHYKPNSMQEIAFDTYLSMVDMSEKSTSIAYLLSQATSDHDGVANLFILFQTPGKKLGQLTHVLELLGPEISKQTKSLKSKAPPLSYMEIHRILIKKGLEDKFETLKVLGSAGIKTVVLIRVIATGELAILCLQNGFAVQSTRTNLAFMKRFVHTYSKKLEAEGHPTPGPFFQAMLEDLEWILEKELDFRIEAKNMKRAAKHLAKPAQVAGLKAHVQVPRVLDEILKPQKDIFVMSVAKGKEWDDWKQQYFDENPDHNSEREQLKLAGKVIVKNMLRMLIRDGFSQADPHGGNFMLDLDFLSSFSHIEFIDLGQALPIEERWFSTYNRRSIIRFMEGLANRDKRLIVSAVRAMATENPDRDKISMLKNSLDEHLPTMDMSSSDSVLDVLNTVYDCNIRLKPQFTLLVFKSLIYLIKEGFISPEDFARELKEQSRPLAILDRLSIERIKAFVKK